MDTRIGFPNEHLAHNTENLEELTSPLYATAVGLVLKGLDGDSNFNDVRQAGETEVKEVEPSPTPEVEEVLEEEAANSVEGPATKLKSKRPSFFERWANKFKEFLDNDTQ
jgi:cell division protein FtsA